MRMYNKFNDNIFVRFSCHEDIIIAFIKELSGPNLRPPCDVIDDVITTKIFFLARFRTIFSYLRSNWSCVQYFYFEVATNFCYQKWYRLKLNVRARFWAFVWRSRWAGDGDIAISKFDLLCDLVTSSMMSWVRETWIAQQDIAN